MGSLVSGVISGAAEDYHNNFRYGGFALSKAPIQLSFYYKLTNDAAPGEDKVFIKILLKKTNSAGKVDTIQFIEQKLLPSDQYIPLQIALSYSFNIAPDSILIGFYSFGYCADDRNQVPGEIGNCLHLKVDKISIDYKDSEDNDISTSPNHFNRDLKIKFALKAMLVFSSLFKQNLK